MSPGAAPVNPAQRVMGKRDAEPFGHAPGRLLPARHDFCGGIPHGSGHFRRRSLRCPGLERRLRRIPHVQLNGFGGRLATQHRRDFQRPIDTRRNARGADQVAVNHNPVIDRSRTEIGKKMQRRPVGRGAPPFEQPCRAADQRPGADREETMLAPAAWRRTRPRTSSSSIRASWPGSPGTCSTSS